MNVNDGTEPCPHCGAAHHPSAIKAYHQGRSEGAAIAFGIMGMAREIQRRRVTIEPVGSDYEVGYWVGFTDAKEESFDDEAVPSPSTETKT